MSLNDLAASCLADSKRWFPDVHRSDHDAVVHFALGASGEIGEVANLIKKVNRGSMTYAEVRGDPHRLDFEIVDSLIYLLDMAATLDIDLDRSFAEKRAILGKRWD